MFTLFISTLTGSVKKMATQTEGCARARVGTLRFTMLVSISSLLLVAVSAPSARAACVGVRDGIVQGPEQCDDGNANQNDNCLNDCTLPFCGDLNLHTIGRCSSDGAACSQDSDCFTPQTCTVAGSLEQCDDGNMVSEDGCSSSCQNEICGDGIVQAGLGESCDPPNTQNGAVGCSNACVQICGNNTTNAGVGETCDGTDLNSETCVSQGFTAGTLACNTDCGGFNTSGCTTCGDGNVEGAETCDPPFSQGGAPGCTASCVDICGNGTTNSGNGELCDGSDIGTETCVSQGFTAGALACNTDCGGFNTSGCTTCGDGNVEGAETCDPPFSQGGAPGCSNSCADLCGNGSINTGTGEVCDASNVGTETCASQGDFDNGVLGCSAGCGTFDTTACTKCGDGVVAGNEQCDKPFNLGGAIGCNDSCQLRVCGDNVVNAGAGEQCDDGNTTDGDGCNSNCQNESCGDGIVQVGLGESCDPPNSQGGAIGCSASCVQACGNNTTNPGVGETCDGTDLSGQTCAGQGFTAGTLACNSDCGAFDTSACTICGDGSVEGAEVCDPPFSQGGAPGCSDACTQVCGNGVINPGVGEVCDGNNLGAETCSTRGDFDDGVLGCSSACDVFDVSACTKCGDTVVAGNEQCDPPFDPATGDNTGCNTVCQLRTCGDGIVNAGAGEQCDDGAKTCASFGASNGKECSSRIGSQGCADDHGQCSGGGNDDAIADACRSNCLLPFCGDGVADSAEFCDDGLRSGQMDPRTRSDIDDRDDCPNGLFAESEGVACIIRNVCGDGIPRNVDTSALCDDGGGAPGSCSPFCVSSDEGCDNGALAGFSSCNGSADSSLTPSGTVTTTCHGDPSRVCVVDQNCVVGAQDFGPCGNSDTVADACRSACVERGCGDDVVDAGESCDQGMAVCVGGPSAGTSCGTDTAICGIGTCIHQADGADPGTGVCNPGPGTCNADKVPDACRTNCALPSCGDGTTDSGEQCDAGAANSVSGNCTDACTDAICGDGKTDTEAPGVEECDDANGSNNDDCLGTCVRNICGDGFENIGVEGCDDGNLTDFDGCSANCCKDAAMVGATVEAHMDATLCDLDAGNVLVPSGDTRVERRLQKRLDNLRRKANRIKDRSGLRSCRRLRSFERQVDRGLRGKVDRAFGRGALSLQAKQAYESLIDQIIGLSRSARALLFC